MNHPFPRQAPAGDDHRAFPRLRIPAMYSLVRVRPAGERLYPHTGHIYDVSLSGMRFELDVPLEPGTAIEVRGVLPGAEHVAFQAAGRVVRFHDEDGEPGPTRMGMHFDHFHSEVDQQRLHRYLDHHQPRLAA